MFWRRYISETFWRRSLDVGTLVPNNSEFFYVCQSVIWLTLLLKLDKYRDISSSVWDIFLKIFGGIPGMFLQLYQIILKFLYVCQSVIWLTSLMKLHKLRNLQFWMRYLSEISWRHSRDFDLLFPNKSEFFYVCKSVIWLLPDWN